MRGPPPGAARAGGAGSDEHPGALYQHTLWCSPPVLAYLHGRNPRLGCGLGYTDRHALETYPQRRAGLCTSQELGLLRRPGRGEDGQLLRELLAGRIVVPEPSGGLTF